MTKLSHGETWQDDTLVVTLSGAVDIGTFRRVRSLLLDALDRTGRLALDLSAVSFLDSSGLANLVELFKRAAGTGKWFRVTAASEPVCFALTVTRLEGLLLAVPAVRSATRDHARDQA